MTLTNPTDDQLNAAFADRVAGWTVKPLMSDPLGLFISPDGKHWQAAGLISPDGKHWQAAGLPFTHSADAVLPWLERVDMLHHINLTFDNYWEFTVSHGEKKWVVGVSKSFAKAAVIALLRAHGVEVEFDK